MKKVFWNYFKATGNIGAYLIFREISGGHSFYYSEQYGKKKRNKLG